MARVLKTRNIIIFVVIALLSIIAVIFFFLRKGENKVTADQNSLIIQHAHLLKTKLALVEHLRLNEDDLDYEESKDYIQTRFTSSHDSGIEHLETMKNASPQKDLIAKTDKVYSEQKDLLEKDDQVIIDHLAKVSNLLRQYLLLIEKSQK